jgi:hypothetical protein
MEAVQFFKRQCDEKERSAYLFTEDGCGSSPLLFRKSWQRWIPNFLNGQ